MGSLNIKYAQECSGRRVRMKMDRISGLGDELLLRILSFLPMYQVVGTSILSKRWRHLWARVPVLDFGTNKPQATDGEIESFVHCCLMLHSAPKIKKLRVRVDHDRIPSLFLDEWLDFAWQRDVEELDMDYIDGYRSGSGARNLRLYPMPECLFRCGALRASRLRGCELKLPASFCLGSLRTMELYHVVFASDLDTSGFPLLESLTLFGCNSTSHLTIYSPNQRLESLTICDESDVLHAASGLKIDAPYLSSIQIGGYMRDFGYTVQNLSSVRHAHLDFICMVQIADISAEESMLGKLLQSLCHVKTLKLCQWCIRHVASRGKSILENSLFSTTCLELDTCFDRREIKGLTHLLSNLHSLETLTVHTQKNFESVGRNNEFTTDADMKTFELAMSCLSHLKTVRIYNLFCTAMIPSNGEPSIILDNIIRDCFEEIRLLKVVLRSCKMLDKMFINSINTQDHTEWMLVSEFLLKLAKSLPKYPRLSANAEIYLS